MSDYTMVLFLNGVQMGTRICGEGSSNVFELSAQGKTQAVPIQPTSWAAVSSLGEITSQIVLEVEYDNDALASAYAQNLQQIDLWRRLVRLYMHKKVSAVLTQQYAESNEASSEIAVYSATSPTTWKLDLGSCLVLNILPGQLAGGSFCSFKFILDISEGTKMLNDFSFKNSDFAIPLQTTSGTQLDHKPQSWYLTNAAASMGAAGISRVINDGGEPALLIRCDSASPAVVYAAYQSWTSPAYVTLGNRCDVCVEVQPRIQATDVPVGGTEQVQRLMRLKVEMFYGQAPNTVIFESFFAVDCSMASSIVLRAPFELVPSTEYTARLTTLTAANGGGIVFCLVKRIYLEQK